MESLKALYCLGVVLYISLISNLHAQNRYQYLFTPNSDYAGKIVKEYMILDGDTTLSNIIEFDEFGFLTLLHNESFDTKREIRYTSSVINISDYSRGRLISHTKLEIIADSVIIVKKDNGGLEYKAGVLYMDMLNKIILHTEENDTISTHHFEGEKLIRSTLYSHNNDNMIVTRTYFDSDSYVEKALENNELVMYNSIINVDENTTSNIQELRLSNGTYSIQKYKEVRRRGIIEHTRFNRDKDELETFQVDSIFSN